MTTTDCLEIREDARPIWLGGSASSAVPPPVDRDLVPVGPMTSPVVLPSGFALCCHYPKGPRP